MLLSLPEMEALQRDIELNGGLRERVILQDNGSRKLKAVEGNSRLVCLQNLHAKNPSDPRWTEVPARILPRDVDPKHVAILLTDFHVAGKIQWKAHEKAGQVYYMHNALGMAQDHIAVHLRTSKTTVNRLLRAYSFMVDRFLKIDDEKYAKEGERKWSYFEELFKQRDLRTELQQNPDFRDDFCRWVGEGRFAPADVRSLPKRAPEPGGAGEAGEEQDTVRRGDEGPRGGRAGARVRFLQAARQGAAGLHQRGAGEGDPADSDRRGRTEAVAGYLRGTCRFHAARRRGPQRGGPQGVVAQPYNATVGGG